jgi:hypothetical protein
MKRDAYFFIVDAIIASLVLFAGLFALFATGTVDTNRVQPLATLDDLVTTLAVTPIAQTVDPYYQDVLLREGLVPYPDATPLEEITYLLFTNRSGVNTTDHAHNYTRSVLANALGEDYGASLAINGTLVATHPHERQRYVLVRLVIVYARLNETVVVGPLLAEVHVWS